jgi:hypothetical protein
MGANAQTTVPTFVASQVLTADQMNQSARTGVPVFADSSARDAGFGGTGEKVLAEGQLCYLEDANVVQYYDSASWNAIGGMTLLSTTTLTGATTAVTNIDQNYNTLFITIEKWYASSNAYLRGYLNADSTSGNYISLYNRIRVGGAAEASGGTYELTGWQEGTSQQDNLCIVSIPNYAGSSMKAWAGHGKMDTDNGAKGTYHGSGAYFSTTAISSITFAPSAGTFSAGTVKIYGVR